MSHGRITKAVVLKLTAHQAGFLIVVMDDYLGVTEDHSVFRDAKRVREKLLNAARAAGVKP